MKKFKKYFAVLLIGFFGGFIAVPFLNIFEPIPVTELSNAVSIANTYIVFTTIIFVGFTVVLGVAGYIITQQISATQEAQENKILEELRTRVVNEERLGISLINAILENIDVKTHLDNKLMSKVKDAITDCLSEHEVTDAIIANEEDMNKMKSGLAD